MLFQKFDHALRQLKLNNFENKLIIYTKHVAEIGRCADVEAETVENLQPEGCRTTNLKHFLT